MKILVGGFQQESNSFSVYHSDINRYSVIRGEQFFDPNANSPKSMLSGIIDSVKEAGYEVIPTAAFSATSGGPVMKKVVDEFLADVLDALKKYGPVDGVFLALHGATDMEEHQDGCGYILETVRKAVGPDVVVVHSGDMHANITDKMMKLSDGCAGYQTYPHIDFYETGARCAMHGIRLLQGKPLYEARVRVPMIVPAEGYDTNQGVFADLINSAHALVKAGRILDFSIFQMQPWLDLPDAGSTVLVSAEDKATAEFYAKDLAQKLFDIRREMEIKLYTVDEVIDAALANETEAPVILVDSADSPNAGSSADSSFVLQHLMERKEKFPACVYVADEPSVEKAFALGVGGTGEFTLGGTKEPNFQKPYTITATVKSLHDGSYMGSIWPKSRKTSGRTAVLVTGEIEIVVMTKMGNSSDPKLYRGFGVEPADFRLVMVKSATQYKHKYSEFSTLFYPTDTPGSSSANLAAMPFKYVPRPFWPLDRMESFDLKVSFYRE